MSSNLELTIETKHVVHASVHKNTCANVIHDLES